MDLEDGKKGRWSCRPERSSMKSLEKAVADYEKAKEKMEASRARYEADLKRFKAYYWTEGIQLRVIVDETVSELYNSYNKERLLCYG